MERKKRNRIAALLLAVTILVIMLYSAFFVAAEADHDCVGEGCPICYQIDACQNTEKPFACCMRHSCCCCVYIYFVQVYFSLHGLCTKRYLGISQGEAFELNKSLLQG